MTRIILSIYNLDIGFNVLHKFCEYSSNVRTLFFFFPFTCTNVEKFMLDPLYSFALASPCRLPPSDATQHFRIFHVTIIYSIRGASGIMHIILLLAIPPAVNSVSSV